MQRKNMQATVHLKVNQFHIENERPKSSFIEKCLAGEEIITKCPKHCVNGLMALTTIYQAVC